MPFFSPPHFFPFLKSVTASEDTQLLRPVHYEAVVLILWAETSSGAQAAFSQGLPKTIGINTHTDIYIAIYNCSRIRAVKEQRKQLYGWGSALHEELY